MLNEGKMLLRLIVIIAFTFSCKSVSNHQPEFSSEASIIVVSPGQRALLAQIIREFYSSPVPGIEDRLPNLIVEDALIGQFANALYNSDNQTSRKLFLELASKSGPPSDEFKTYVLQEFSVMTNLIQKTVTKLGAGIEIPLTFIGNR